MLLEGWLQVIKTASRLLLLLLATFAYAASGTTTVVTTTWDGITRTYTTYVPKNLPASPPMVFCLHPTVGDKTGAKPPLTWCNGWKSGADTYQYVLVYPVSTWNPVSEKWYWDAYNVDDLFPTPPDDSGFIRNLIQTLTVQYNVNPLEVFVYGMSSGGFMAHRVGIDSSDLVAAIASSSGMLWASTDPVPNILQPVSVLQCEGSLDTTVPPCKGTFNAWGQKQLPDATVDDILNYWLAQNNLPPNTGAPMCTDGQLTGGVSGYDALESSGAEVQYVLLVGAGHGCDPAFKTTIDEFFLAHPKPSSF